MSSWWLAEAARRLRALRKGWTSQSDQAFHDALFAGGPEDPFSFSYPGYLTIRRFADLVSPLLREGDFAVDLGCGPGEITCELARRHPDVTFAGVDHSRVAIERARGHADRLGLENVVFERADVERHAPPRDIDIVLMFDAFHHLTHPSELVHRLRSGGTRFALIEPQGDWLGRWRRELDVDWLISDLEKIRVRLALTTGEPEVPREPSGAPEATALSPDDAVENRYGWNDFRRFFPGLNLQVRGTVAGIETYPLQTALGGMREHFGRLAYDLVCQVDEVLYASDRDFDARHWLVHAAPDVTPRPPLRPVKPGKGPANEVQGPYDVDYQLHLDAKMLPADAEIRALLGVTNRGFRAWDAHKGQNPVRASYHWIDSRGVMVEEDGERSPLPRSLGPGESCELELRVRTPAHPGRYVLAIDLVHEGVTWFSRAGVPCLRRPLRVRRRR
jgi:SAM-dependent methyltransferase